ncbi:hypothetical protein [Halorhodospira halochloris]|uniref:hypothetical protein n=1 Tax=Halorhodospira halochloris TaxID=1052 RepID=UPI0013A53A39|nr:hypothetical protein [Halorhodospira halochloris]
MNPSLEASWRHPWRQDLHTGADSGASGVFRGTLRRRVEPHVLSTRCTNKAERWGNHLNSTIT